MKKKLLFGLMAVLLAGVGFGGISMADNIVTTEDGLIEAVANTAIDEIVLGNNIALNHSLVVNRAVTIDGGEFTLSLPNTTYVSNGDNYVIKAYADNAGVTLKNIVLSDCLGAVVVGPTTTLNVDETVDVSNNVWGGIELQLGAKLVGAPIIYYESFNHPVAWVDAADKGETTVDSSLNEVARADKSQVFFYSTESAVVTTEDELVAAVANTTIEEIILGDDIALNHSLVVNRAVTIDGGEFTLSLPNTTYVSNGDNYVIKAYAEGEVTLKNIVLSDCLGAVVVGPTTTLNVDETVDVSDNVWGGIELQKGATLKGAPTMDDESFNRPVAWVDDADKGETTVDSSLNEVVRADKTQVFFYKNTQLVPVNFYSSEDLPFPVVLSSDGKSIDRDSTKIVVNSSTLIEGDETKNTYYKNLILETLNGETIIDVATIAGERVLFVGDNKGSTFRDSIDGKLGSNAFKTNGNPSTVDSKLYNLESEDAVMPSWLDGVEFTVRHTNEVKDGDNVIGYTINVEYSEGKVAWIFAPASYTVTFDVAGASSAIDPMHVDYNSTISAPTQPTKNGYNFDGWYNGETKFDFTTPITDNITLTAQWTKKSSGGGSSSSSSNKTPTTTGTVETGTVDTGAENSTTGENIRYEEGNQQEVLKNGFTREFNNAYNFAYLNGITTMKNISKADMNGNLNRIAMAKMLSQYAINVLGKTPDTTKKCEFKDVTSKMDKDYNDGVTLACQLGIMGMNMGDNFRPNDTVVRAEFGTALSRMIYGISDGKDQYYSTHLAKLKAKKVITNDNPSLQELRGYVMLMLMRSAK